MVRVRFVLKTRIRISYIKGRVSVILWLGLGFSRQGFELGLIFKG